MGFRENLKEELKYQGIYVKELADKSGVPKGTIDHYLAEKSTAPTAESAVKIAKTLGVSVEYLVTGSDAKEKYDSNKYFFLYEKYHSIIEALELLPETKKRTVTKIIEQCIELGKE